MATTKQTTIRFTDEDLALLEAIAKRLGILSRTDVIRMALRELAKIHGVTVPASPLPLT